MGIGALGLGGAAALGKGGGGGASTPEATQWQQQIAMDLYRQSNPLRQSLLQNSMNFMGVPAAQQQQRGALSQLQSTGGKDPMFTTGGGTSGAGLDWNTPINLIGDPAVLRGQPGGGMSYGPSRGMDVRNTQAGQAFKYSADAAFQNALNNTTGRFARGGPLQAAVTNLEGQRAGALTQGYGQLWGDEYNRAFQLATGMVPTAVGGLGQAGSVAAQIAQANAAESAAGKGAMGTGLGALAGGYFGSK